VISRRAFVVMGATSVATPFVARAQQGGKVPRIGVIRIAPLGEGGFQDALRQGFRDRGYVEGQNIVIEWRSADGLGAAALGLADELVGLDLDLIVAVPTPAVEAPSLLTRAAAVIP
jgi:putative ABC transport system substrate-binding protein